MDALSVARWAIEVYTQKLDRLDNGESWGDVWGNKSDTTYARASLLIELAKVEQLSRIADALEKRHS